MGVGFGIWVDNDVAIKIIHKNSLVGCVSLWSTNRGHRR